MSKTSVLSTSFLIAAAFALAPSVAPAATKDVSLLRAEFGAPHDMSAARRYRGRVYAYRRYPHYAYHYAAPSFGFIGPPGYPGEYAWRKSIGQCVHDLGYGRWKGC